MEPRRLQVAMDEILDAMTVSEADPIRFFLNLDTGNVESRFSPEMFGDPDEDDDFDQRFEANPERFEEIPKYASRDEYNLMCRFADTIDEEDIRERLDVALQGKGAFRRFRDVVFRYPDLKAQWFAARQQALLQEALVDRGRCDRAQAAEAGQALGDCRAPARKGGAACRNRRGGPEAPDGKARAPAVSRCAWCSTRGVAGRGYCRRRSSLGSA
jgi:hypothetical protein